MGKRSTAVSVAIAAAGSMDDDAAQRRRVQYKIYQRQHRARQKNKALRLEQEVATLAEEITQLATQHQELLLLRNQQNVFCKVFSSRTTPDGAPARAVAEFYRVYEHGHDHARRAAQAQFMRAIMARDVQGPDYTGVETLIDQWQLYGNLFQRTHYAAQRFSVESFDDVTVVVVDVLMTIQLTHGGAVQLYPSVGGDEATIQQLVTTPLRVRGSVRFVFDETSTVTWFGADMDFIAGMVAVLGSAKRVSGCVEKAQMSLCTGRITMPDPSRRWCDTTHARRRVDDLPC